MPDWVHLWFFTSKFFPGFERRCPRTWMGKFNAEHRQVPVYILQQLGQFKTRITNAKIQFKCSSTGKRPRSWTLTHQSRPKFSPFSVLSKLCSHRGVPHLPVLGLSPKRIPYKSNPYFPGILALLEAELPAHAQLFYFCNKLQFPQLLWLELRGRLLLCDC